MKRIVDLRTQHQLPDDFALVQPDGVTITRLPTANGVACHVLHPDGREWTLTAFSAPYSVHVARRRPFGDWGSSITLPHGYTDRFKVNDYRSLVLLARDYCV